MSAFVGWVGSGDRRDWFRDLGRMAGGSRVCQGAAPWRFTVHAAGGLGWMPGPCNHDKDCDQQPLEVDGLIFVADARLDNRDELLRALGVPPAAQVLSDGALILKAYRAWGADTPRRLLGDFAFAVWNTRSSTLFCARDHRGKRPLFYHWSPRALVLASSPQALLALSHVPRRLDLSALAGFMASMGDESKTLFEGILRLPPACTLTATADGVRLQEYWRMEVRPTARFSSEDECLEEFKSLFDQAVACRLPYAGSVGAFLSGGLDSSSVACVAAQQLKAGGKRLTTFTAVPRQGFAAPEIPGWYGDETPFIEAIRRLHDNLDVSYIRTGTQTFLDSLEQSFDLLGFPVANAANRVWIDLILERAAAAGLCVLLNGTEGNLWMSYKGVSRSSVLGKLGLALSSGAAGERTRAVMDILKGDVIAPLLPTPLWRAYQQFKPKSAWPQHSPMRPEFAVAMKVRERYLAWPLGPLARSEKKGHPATRIALATHTLFCFENDLQNAFRLSYGIDMRDPTADKRLIEFCLSLPEGQYARAGQHRLLVRRSMTGVLPHEVLWNQKRGLQAADSLEAMAGIRQRLASELDRLERIETAAWCLDFPRLRRALHALPRTINALTSSQFHEAQVLARGVTVGRYIRWFEAT